METTLRWLGAGIGFLVIMTAASMVVATLVRVIHYFRRSRGKHLHDMLASINLGYRAEHGDAVRPGDAESEQFVDDVLRDPILVSPAAAASQTPSDATSAAELKRRLHALRERIDYVPRETVLHIVAQRARDDSLPSTWHRALPAEAATPAAFSAYIVRTFPVAEGAASDRFRTEAQRLVTALSLLLVLAVNFNTLELLPRLHDDQAAQALRERRAHDLLATADRTGLTRTPDAADDLASFDATALTQSLAIFDEPALGFGWQRSAYVRGRCAREAACAARFAIAPLGPQPWPAQLLDFAAWVTGLLLSWILLSLGAPYWADRLRAALNLRTAVQARVAGEKR